MTWQGFIGNESNPSWVSQGNWLLLSISVVTLVLEAWLIIETAHRSSVLVIPSEFVFWRNGKPGVFIDAAGKARWRELTLGLQGQAAVEVTRGLDEGEYVVKPMESKSGLLVEGQRIKRS